MPQIKMSLQSCKYDSLIVSINRIQYHTYTSWSNGFFLYNLYISVFMHIVCVINYQMLNPFFFNFTTFCNFLHKYFHILFYHLSVVEYGFFFILEAPYGKYWVLDTDYDHYTLIYSCTDLAGLSHIEFAWILSRSRTLDDQYKTKLFDLVTSYGIKTSNFQTEVQEGCS